MFALHHVQLAMPRGEEDAARAFYAGPLGMHEAPKPPILAERGGVWFRLDGLEIHLGVEDGFTPAKKAHPGILTDELNALASRLSASGAEVTPDTALPGFRRFYVNDCFGNRLEFLERSESE